MTYNARRCETLQRLGIEQLPTLYSDRMSQRAEYSDANEMISPLGGNLPVRTMPVPGKRCPCCKSRGYTVWVIPGKRCPQCGAEVN